MINLNEECLLQFLKNETGVAVERQMELGQGGDLTTDLHRIFRRNQYVSFPPAILVRRKPL